MLELDSADLPEIISEHFEKVFYNTKTKILTVEEKSGESYQFESKDLEEFVFENNLNFWDYENSLIKYIENINL